jgi:hypothetical protein
MVMLSTVCPQVYQSVLSPDELFAPGNIPLAAAGIAAADARRGGKGGKKATLSKVQQQRQEKLDAEVRCTRFVVLGW